MNSDDDNTGADDDDAEDDGDARDGRVGAACVSAKCFQWLLVGQHECQRAMVPNGICVVKSAIEHALASDCMSLVTLLPSCDEAVYHALTLSIMYSDLYSRQEVILDISTQGCANSRLRWAPCQTSLRLTTRGPLMPSRLRAAS